MTHLMTSEPDCERMQAFQVAPLLGDGFPYTAESPGGTFIKVER